MTSNSSVSKRVGQTIEQPLRSRPASFDEDIKACYKKLSPSRFLEDVSVVGKTTADDTHQNVDAQSLCLELETLLMLRCF
jgi:hypothetical protein